MVCGRTREKQRNQGLRIVSLFSAVLVYRRAVGDGWTSSPIGDAV
jgi:hypothetical protein